MLKDGEAGQARRTTETTHRRTDLNALATQNPNTIEEKLDRIFRLLMVVAVMVMAIVVVGYSALVGLFPIH